jgi:hypothetical protein
MVEDRAARAAPLIRKSIFNKLGKRLNLAA